MLQELIEFCERNLRDTFDAETFAKELLEETEDNYFEIRGMFTKTGNPVTLDLR